MNDVPGMIESAQADNHWPARKRPSSHSPTKRTLDRLRKMGWDCYVVEKWNQHARIRQDAFGFGDVLAMKPGVGILLVQACAGASLAARRDKLLAEPRVATWLLAGGRVEIWAWRKTGDRGKQKRWHPLVQELALSWQGYDQEPGVWAREARDLDQAALP